MSQLQSSSASTRSRAAEKTKKKSTLCGDCLRQGGRSTDTVVQKPVQNNHEIILVKSDTVIGCEVEEAEAEAEPNAATPLDDRNTGRVQWTSSTEFLLTCIGYSVGLGNVWRFPYLCYKNGGGAFLIPYSIMIVFIGVPLLFMEYSFGQYFGIGSLSIFKIVCPLFQGVGICYSILNCLVCIYYNIIIALSVYYIFGSFTTNLPWASCDNAWNTLNCGYLHNLTADNSSNTTSSSLSSDSVTVMITTSLLRLSTDNYNSSGGGGTGGERGHTLPRSSPSDEFFRLELMGEGAEHNIGNLGRIQWKLCLCLLLSWILVAIFVSKGIKSSGKVSYLTTTFPYVMLTILVVRGATLPGAWNGILYFIVPEWSKLASPDVWFQAATQMFYSINLAWGGMLTMSSYNTLNHNCYRDAIVINCVSFATSLYAGIAVFSVIGFMAYEYKLPITEVIKSGPGLAFVAYPQAISRMPWAPFFSVAFFFMLFLLGIGSQMVGVETIMTGIMDTWWFLVKKWQYRVATILVVCSLGFLLGIPCTTQGGMYVLQLMDHYSAGFSVLIIAIIECIVINWIYGHERMKEHIFQMIGRRLQLFWTICWKFLSPALILVILVFSFVRYKPVEYGASTYPVWADVIGWLMTLASVVPILVVGVYVFARAKGSTLKQKWVSSTAPKTEDNVTSRCGVESMNMNCTKIIGHEIIANLDTFPDTINPIATLIVLKQFPDRNMHMDGGAAV